MKKNIYLESKVTKMMQNRKNPLVNNELTSDLIDVLKDNESPKKITDIDPEKYDLKSILQLFPPPGVQNTCS